MEIDEIGHTDRDKNDREKKIKEKLGCKFIWIDPDEKDYDKYVKCGEKTITLVNQIKYVM